MDYTIYRTYAHQRSYHLIPKGSSALLLDQHNDCFNPHRHPSMPHLGYQNWLGFAIRDGKIIPEHSVHIHPPECKEDCLKEVGIKCILSTFPGDWETTIEDTLLPSFVLDIDLDIFEENTAMDAGGFDYLLGFLSTTRRLECAIIVCETEAFEEAIEPISRIIQKYFGRTTLRTTPEESWWEAPPKG